MSDTEQTMIHGDCVAAMRLIEKNTFDAIVTDPPYGLGKPPDIEKVLTAWLSGQKANVTGGGFMNASWDSFVPGPRVWREAFRVIKPGGHVLCFAGTRTSDLMSIALRLAGFQIVDNLVWIFASGMPKGADISKQIDKRGGNAHLTKQIGQALREARVQRGLSTSHCDKIFCDGSTNYSWFEGRPKGQTTPTPTTFSRIVKEWPELASLASAVDEVERATIGKRTVGLGTGKGTVAIMQDGDPDVTAPATDEARLWQGWRSQIKPAHEPILVAMKPLDGTFANNALKHGVAGYAIDRCRIPRDGEQHRPFQPSNTQRDVLGQHIGFQPTNAEGGYPMNVLLDDVAADMLDAQAGSSKSSGIGRKKTHKGDRPGGFCDVGADAGGDVPCGPRYLDEGGRSRYFSRFKYQAKTSKKEREAGLDIVLDDKGKEARQNRHPTVKPIEFMCWLVCLVSTPEDTFILDPFAGSGTTGIACALENFDFIGIDQDAEYVEIAKKRISYWKIQGKP